MHHLADAPPRIPPRGVRRLVSHPAIFARLVVVLLGAGNVAAGAQGVTPRSSLAEAGRYDERFRPQYHFTPARNWMNDPNGLVYYQGEYHLFYQFNPFGDKWGHLSWGHAVSPDMLHWRHLPVAIPELGPEMVFSGSVVVDSLNTSGFGRGGRAPLVAIFTASNSARKTQAQALAYSVDRGRTWTRFSGNPVLDIGAADFRDPKVLWYAPEKKWVMVLALPQAHKVLFYSSRDLKKWTKMSEFGPAGATGGVWECPDLFPLDVDSANGVRRWVLIASINPGGIAGGSATQYFVGDFDGTRFVSDSSHQNGPALWSDFGRDYYAAVSFFSQPPNDKRRVWLGWMSNWDYAQDVPTTPWRSAQSIPRSLTLRDTPAGYRLVQRPIEELRALRGTKRQLSIRELPGGDRSLDAEGVRGTALEIALDLHLATARAAGVKVLRGPNEETIVGVDAAKSVVFIDRRRSGDTTFHPGFAGRHEAPVTITNGRVQLRVFVDRSSVELFANDGEATITDLAFPSAGSDGVALFSDGGVSHVISGEVWPLASVWTSSSAKSSTSTIPKPPARKPSS